MAYNEDELIPISALQHYVFCPRQFALIHIEQAWEENLLTAEGRLFHRRVHEDGAEWRQGQRKIHGLRIHSLELGLVGQTDLVELTPIACDEFGVSIPNYAGSWRLLPVEYKRGTAKLDNCDKVQLCAQVFCLEEMFGTTLHRGAFFYGENRRRVNVEIDETLREFTKKTISEVRACLQYDSLPPARHEPKCRNCSLLNLCAALYLEKWSEQRLRDYTKSLNK